MRRDGQSKQKERRAPGGSPSPAPAHPTDRTLRPTESQWQHIGDGVLVGFLFMKGKEALYLT